MNKTSQLPNAVMRQACFFLVSVDLFVFEFYRERWQRRRWLVIAWNKQRHWSHTTQTWDVRAASFNNVLKLITPTPALR